MQQNVPRSNPARQSVLVDPLTTVFYYFYNPLPSIRRCTGRIVSRGPFQSSRRGSTCLGANFS